MTRQREEEGESSTGDDSASTLKTDSGFNLNTGKKYVTALVKTINFARGDTVLSSLLDEKLQIIERRQQPPNGADGIDSGTVGENVAETLEIKMDDLHAT